MILTECSKPYPVRSSDPTINISSNGHISLNRASVKHINFTCNIQIGLSGDYILIKADNNGPFTMATFNNGYDGRINSINLIRNLKLHGFHLRKYVGEWDGDNSCLQFKLKKVGQLQN